MRQDWWYDITETVCQTVTGSDISVAAAKDGGLTKVTVSGKGLLSGASITLPVGSLEDFVGQLGWVRVLAQNKMMSLNVLGQT